MLPAEFSARYREQFFDRLWLHGLGYAGLLYAIGLVIYFCAVGWLGYQTQSVEAQVAALSGSYTNAIQLKARLGVLQERLAVEIRGAGLLATGGAGTAAGHDACSAPALWTASKLALSGQVDAADTQKAD